MEPNGEIIEIEVFARENKKEPAPKGKKYKIRIDKDNFTIEKEIITGRELLGLVNKNPELYNLYQHVHQGQTIIIKPNDEVDLTAPGVERFSTLKIENTEG